MARIEALLRRAGHRQWAGERVGEHLRLVPERRAVVWYGGEVRLGDIEYRLLQLLVRNRGRVVTTKQLLTRVWGGESAADGERVKFGVLRLRRKLRGAAGPGGRDPVEAVRGLGYRFISAEVGGNGQFTRLTALDRIAAAERRPWKQDALLEDYELGMQMRLAGYRVTHVPDAWVTQEALPRTRRFLTQRTRWAQGNIQCVRYAGRIIGSRHYRARGVLESLYTFFQPIAHLTVLALTAVLVFILLTGVTGAVLFAAWPLALALGILSIVPFVLWGPVYRREFAPDRSRLTGVLWGITLWLYAYHLFIVSARGSVRLLRGKTGWAKTRRNAETVGTGPTATEA